MTSHFCKSCIVPWDLTFLFLLSLYLFSLSNFLSLISSYFPSFQPFISSQSTKVLIWSIREKSDNRLTKRCLQYILAHWAVSERHIILLSKYAKILSPIFHRSHRIFNSLAKMYYIFTYRHTLTCACQDMVGPTRERAKLNLFIPSLSLPPPS